MLDGDLAESVAKLKADLDGDIVVHGSAQLVQGLLEANLVDELRLMVFPVVLGSGKRLFGETSDKKPLRLTSATDRGGRGLDPRSTSGPSDPGAEEGGPARGLPPSTSAFHAVPRQPDLRLGLARAPERVGAGGAAVSGRAS